MIRFKLYNSKPDHIKLLANNHPHLFAQDDIPVRSRLEITSEGELLAERHSDMALGLATLWNVDGFGRVQLQTTRLPGRERPYNLNVELARGQLLRISQKREEWGISDSDAASPVLIESQHDLIDRALDNLVQALSLIDHPEQAAIAADKALVMAMKAGEEISLAHAKLFLDRRHSTHGFSRHSFGCCLDTARIRDTKYLKFIKDNFRFVTVPVSWRQIEPKEQVRNFEWLDECVNWLSRNRIAVKVGPLLNFLPGMLPDWLFIWENDFDQVREMAYDYITSVVERYSNKVQAWDVISGMNVENCFKFSFEQIIEMTRSGVLAAKRTAPRSLILVELTEPWGEYYAYNQRALPPLIYVDMICQSGANFDGLGVKLRFGRGGGGMRTRDILDISCLLDKLGVFGKSIHLASVQVPSKPDPRDNSGPLGDPGFWHGPWSEDTQALWLDQVYQVALSKPYVETITWADLADRDNSILLHGGLLQKDLVPKPAFKIFRKIKKRLLREEHPGSIHQKP